MPLVNHTGTYTHPAYDRLFLNLRCRQTEAASTSPLNPPHDEDECGLVVARGPETQIQFRATLEHKTGDFWLAYAFLEETPDVLQGCFRTEFRLDARGIVTHVGIDLRIEEADAPLVWFQRVEV